MYAVIETGGKQYRVKEGDVLFVEKLDAEKGDTITIDNVLLVADNGDVKVGNPFVDGTKVEAKVMEHGKGKKVIVFKYRAKKHSKRKQGHRDRKSVV